VIFLFVFTDPSTNENICRPLEDLTVSDACSCSCCGVQFADSSAQRNHFKLDWHRYNIKRQLAGLSAIKEEAFGTLADKGILFFCYTVFLQRFIIL